jgi:hypothetical protein
VISTDQANSGILCSVMPGARMLKMVVMKLMAPRIDEAPAMCSDRIAKIHGRSGLVRPCRERRIDGPAAADAVGWPAALGTNIERTSSRKAGGSSQKEMLFMRGNAMSGAPIMIGTNQLPKPPISAGMTMKKIMIRPCAVVKALNRHAAGWRRRRRRSADR